MAKYYFGSLYAINERIKQIIGFSFGIFLLFYKLILDFLIMILLIYSQIIDI